MGIINGKELIVVFSEKSPGIKKQDFFSRMFGWVKNLQSNEFFFKTKVLLQIQEFEGKILT